MRTSFFFSEALGSLRRNWVMTMAAILTVFISMSILGVAMVTDRNLNQGATSLKNRILIKVFISDNATPEQVTALQQKIDSMPQIKKAVYISKDQALEAFRKMMGSQANEILSALPNNPLPADYDVYVKNSNQVESVAQQFVGNPAVDDNHAGLRSARQRRVRQEDGAPHAGHHQPHREGHVGRDDRVRLWRPSCSSRPPCGCRSSPAGARSRSCAWWAPPTGSSAGPSCSRAS